MKMEIFEKAKELGNMISESKEFLSLRDAEEAIIKDQAAMDLLNAFGSVREEYANALQTTEDEAELEKLKTNLISKNDELMNNTVTKNYIDAKAKVDNIFKTVSDILLKAVNGEHEEEGGCSSGGCGSCGCGCG
jgi:cell fate (sporulation/competence/biofilm development) regulator YlbF (YheA/YmcA/DUF963 family)